MRIAAAQVHAAWLDTPRTTSIVTDWLGRAAAGGVELEVSRRRLAAVEFDDE